MSGVAPLLLSLSMLAVAVLVAAGIRLAVSGRDRRRGVLMVIAGLVVLGNVLILVWPTPA